MASTVRFVAHPVIDFGGTHCRVGWVARITKNGRFIGTPKIMRVGRFECPLNKIGQPDIKATLAIARKMITEMTPSKIRILKIIGGSFPGAWLENGYAYPGTANNTEELENYPLAKELSKLMGEGWQAYINNDGVANVLAIAQGLMTNLNRFPAIKEALRRSPKVAGFIPGTGFGAGAFKVKGSSLVPVSGFQQFFDMAIGKGPGVVDPKNKRTTPEDFAAGVGLAFQAKHSILKKLYSDEELSPQRIGKLLARLAFSSQGVSDAERQAALALYRGAARALVDTMILTHDGVKKGERRKLVVNDPPELETQFWRSIKGTRVFIFGGWLTNPQVKRFMADAVADELRKAGRTDLHFVFSDEIKGIQKMIDNDSVALVGAALLVPGKIKA
jgi:hypothetical protein